MVTFLVERVYSEPLQSYSLGPTGISSLQKKVPASIFEFGKLQADYGSGNEVFWASMAVLVWGPRARFVYYMLLIAVIDLFVPIIKMIYSTPRPYLVNPDITPYKCALCYANPSGHSFASTMAGFTIFLDLFHSTPTQSSKNLAQYSEVSASLYKFCLFLAIFWVLSMPTSRYIGGMHTLNQILFGSTLGLYFGFICHFLLRDRVVGAFESLELESTEKNPE